MEIFFGRFRADLVTRSDDETGIMFEGGADFVDFSADILRCSPAQCLDCVHIAVECGPAGKTPGDFAQSQETAHVTARRAFERADAIEPDFREIIRYFYASSVKMMVEQPAMAVEFLGNGMKDGFIPFSPEGGAEEGQAAPGATNEEAFEGGILAENSGLSHQELDVALLERFQFFFVFEKINDGLFESAGSRGCEEVEKGRAEIAFQKIGVPHFLPGANGVLNIGLVWVAVEMKMNIDGQIFIPILDRRFCVPNGGIILFGDGSFSDVSKRGVIERHGFKAVMSPRVCKTFYRDIRRGWDRGGGNAPPFAVKAGEGGAKGLVEGDFSKFDHIHPQKTGRIVIPEFWSDRGAIAQFSPIGIEHALFGRHGEESIFFIAFGQTHSVYSLRFVGDHIERNGVVKKMKVGIIGMGAIGSVHADAYRAVGEESEIVAVCDVDHVRLDQKAKALGVEARFTDYRKLLAKGDVEAVSVCVGNTLHKEVAVAALQAGKHVLLEKPMAMNAQEAAQIVDAAKASGRTLQIGMVRRQDTDAQLVRELIQNGAFGEIYHIRAVLIRRRGIPGLGGWFTTRAQSGGGPLIDIGVHWFDAALFVSGLWNPTAVSAMTYAKFGPDMRHYRYVSMWAGPPKYDGVFDVEDYAAGFVRFGGHASMSFEIAWACNAEDGGFIEFLGTKSGARIFDGKPFKLLTEYGERIADVTPYRPDRGNPFHNQIKAFLAACRGERPPAATGEEGLIVMKLIDAVYQSAEVGREVAIR